MSGIKSIYSEAFPPSKRKNKSNFLSSCHELLKGENLKEENISYRPLDKNDLEEILLLHREWFPIKYEEKFFEQLYENYYGNFYSLCAVYKLENKEKEIIVGFISVDYQYVSDKFESHTSDEILQKISEEISFYDDMNCNLTFENYRCAYIMTLGVIDEFRRMKIGSNLISLVMDYYLYDTLCICLYLDVISYNSSAIKFYKRNNFEEVTTIKNFYKIDGNVYDSKVFVLPFTKIQKKEYRKKHFSFFFNYFVYYLNLMFYLIMYVISLNLCCRCIRKKHKLD